MTLAEPSLEFGIRPTMISTWKQELMKRVNELFVHCNKASSADHVQKVTDDLHRKIGSCRSNGIFPRGSPAISRLLRGGR